MELQEVYAEPATGMARVRAGAGESGQPSDILACNLSNYVLLGYHHYFHEDSFRRAYLAAAKLLV